MFDIIPTAIADLYEMRPLVRSDSRGRLVKTMHAQYFASRGLGVDFVEQYYTVSKRNVVRGFHFQLPPHNHYKLVSCLLGEVHDVVIDLRRGSRSYGHHVAFRLTAALGNQIHVPTGCAHGFAALSDESLLLYNVSAVHAPSHDAGVRWDSAGITWPISSPIVSDRDLGLPPLESFASPF